MSPIPLRAPISWKNRSRCRRAALLLLGGLVLAAPASAQEPDSPFGEQIDVRVVNVEVVVTDREGKRVTGLAPADFRLRIDGKEAPIEYFTEVSGGTAAAPAAPPPAEAAAPGERPPGLTPGTTVGTSYLVFVDDSFAMAPRRNEVLRGLKAQIATLGPEDRMAVVAFDGRQLTRLTDGSGAPGSLARSFDQAMARPAGGPHRQLARGSADGSSAAEATDPTGGNAREAGPSLRMANDNRLSLGELAYAEELVRQVKKSVAAAAASLRTFGAPPGRRVLILLAGGWPYNIAEYVANDFSRTVAEPSLPTGEQLLQPLTDTANRLGYSIYAVDVPGVEYQGPTVDSQAPAGYSFSVRERDTQASLEYVAAETGGQALLNSVRGETLPRVQEDTRSYYSLGFTPPAARDDKRHRVEVDVRRLGLRSRYRESYLDLSRQAETTMSVESALLFGGAAGTPKLQLQTGPAKRSGRRNLEMPVTLTIPTGMITVLPAGGKYVGELELRVAALDERGERSEMPVIPVVLRFDRKPEPGSFARYKTRLQVRNIEQRLVLAVSDPSSGKTALAELDFVPPK